MTRLTDAIVNHDGELALKISKGEDWLANLERLWFSLKYLGKHAYFDETDNNDQTHSSPLHLLAEYIIAPDQLPELIKALIEQGADVSRRNVLNETPLDSAISKNNIIYARELLNSKAQSTVNCTGARYTPLQALILNPDHNLTDLEFFLDKNAAPDQISDSIRDYKDIPGNGLHYAVWHYPESKIEFLQAIIKHTININSVFIKDGRRHTALSMALELQKPAFAAALLQAGASPYIFGPAAYAGKSKHMQPKELLKFAGFPVLLPAEIQTAEAIATAQNLNLEVAKQIQNGICHWTSPGYIGIFARSSCDKFGIAKFTPLDNSKAIIYIYPPNNTAWGPFDLREAGVVIKNFEKLVSQVIESPKSELDRAAMCAATTLVFSVNSKKNIENMTKVIFETASSKSLMPIEGKPMSNVLSL